MKGHGVIEELPQQYHSSNLRGVVVLGSAKFSL